MNTKLRFFGIAAVLLIWLVTGCTHAGEMPQPVQEPEESTAAPTETAPAETALPTAPETEPETQPEPTLPVSTRRDTPGLTQEMMTFTVEGMEEEVPVFSWDFGTYRVCIPSQDWSFTQLDNAERWSSDWNDQVIFTVYHYDGCDGETAAQSFAADSGYVFEDLMGGISAQDCLMGMRWPMLCCFFAAEDGTVVAWEYPVEAAEGFGSRMAQMAATFALIE